MQLDIFTIQKTELTQLITIFFCSLRHSEKDRQYKCCIVNSMDVISNSNNVIKPNMNRHVRREKQNCRYCNEIFKHYNEKVSCDFFKIYIHIMR